MRRAPFLFLALFFVSQAAAAQAQVAGGPRSGRWAHEGSTLAPDDKVTWGRLSNGVRYALLPHQGVPGSVSLRLVVLAGSMDELPAEHGIAHFTEHMAFNGTRNFREQDMVALFHRLGVEYGSDVNANTSYDTTSYMLEYRENTPGLLREGLALFRDIGDGIAFDPAAIERERRVILSEMRARDTLGERKMQASLPVLLRGLPMASRSPIGTESSILAVTRDDFLRFYRRNYRPDLMVVVAAGDFAAAQMIGFIQETLGAIPPAAGPAPVRAEGRLDNRALRAGVFRINGIGSAETLAGSALAPVNKPDSQEAFIERQRRSFVMSLLGERLQTRVNGVGSPTSEYNRVAGYELATASVQVPGTEWAHGVLALDQIIRNTQRNGFERGEIDLLRSRRLRMDAHAVGQIATADPQTLATSLMESIIDHTVFIGLEREHLLLRQWLERFTAAEALATFRALWNIDAIAYQVAGDVPVELRDAQVVARVQQHRRSGIAYLPPPPLREDATLIKATGEPGAIAERREVADFRAVLMRYANNVRLNFVSSRQEPGLASAVVRIGAGVIDMPPNQPALKEFGLVTLLASGTGRHAADQIRLIAQERFLEFSFDVSDRDAFSFRATMGVENLETFLGMVAEFMSVPQFTSFAHDAARAQAGAARQGGSGVEEGYRDLTNHLFNGDTRFTFGRPIDYISLGVGDVRRWLEPALRSGYVEITIVGDIAEKDAASLVGRTLGSLPQRAAEKKPARDASAKVTAAAGLKRIEYLGEHNTGLAIGNWPVEGELSVRDKGALHVLAKVLALRVREEVRQKLGLSYAPMSEFADYSDMRGLAMIEVNADAAPAETERVARVFSEVAAKLAEEGATAGEFNGALGIAKSQHRRALLQNDFLVATLLRAQERPPSLEEAIALKTGILDRITLEEVNGWARKVLVAGNSRTAALVPKAFIGVFDSAR